MESAIVKGQSYVLANNAVARNGEFACINASGLAAAAAVGTGLTCVGFFDTSHGNDVTGDGTTATVRIRFMDSNELLVADNDGTNALTAASVGKTAYLFDGHTVSSNATGTSIAGKVVGFRGSKVLVKPTGF